MKKKLQVKRLFTAAAFAVAATGMTSAQELSYEGNDNSMQPIPASLTVDGKVRIAVGDRNSGIDIYNKNLVKETSISMMPQTVYGEVLIQEATAIVTGAKIVGDPFASAKVYSYYNPETYTYETLQATSLEEGLEKLKSLYMNENEEYKIYNIDGYSFAASSSTYLLEDFFGTKYPSMGNFYTCKDGYLYYYGSGIKYELQYDGSNPVWTTTNVTTDNMYYYNVGAEELYYVNADGHSQLPSNHSLRTYMYVTQNFFNDDDEWEYVVPIYEETETAGTPSVKQTNSDGTVTLTRPVTKSYKKTGYRAVSQNGGVLLTLSFPTEVDYDPTLWTINGKNYIQITRSKTADYRDGIITELYAIERGSSNVRKVLEHEAEASSFIIPEGQQIRILLGEGEDENDVVLTSASGQMVFSQHVGAGVTSATVSTTSLAKGVYVVSVSRGGRVLRSQKIKI